MDEYDYIIIGGGMSGLALVQEMISNGITKDKTLAIIEKREEYRQDKFWSFWNVENSDYSDIALHEWSKFSLKYEKAGIQVDSPYPYVTIDSNLYYQKILQQVDDDENVFLFLNKDVAEIIQLQNRVCILFESEDIIYTNQLFDSRIDENMDLGKFGLLQHFKGIVIETENDVFDADTVELMDFQVNQEWGLHFMYILPLSSNRAMVEATWFSERLVTENIYNKQIANYFEKNNIDGFSVKYEEKGIIPMTTNISQDTTWSSVINIGTRGGITRPSTGYTFLFAQWHAKTIVNSLKLDKTRIKPVRSAWINFLDQILLRVLVKHQKHGPEIFVKLFKNNNKDRVIRFLSGTSSLDDELIIMLKTPKIHLFIKEAIFELFSRLKFW